MSSPASQPNFPTATALAAAKQRIGEIRDRYRRSTLPGIQRVPYLGVDYERDLHACLSAWLNYCVLPGIRVFSPSNRSTGELAHELDNIFHIRFGDTDYIILVEAKAQPIAIKEGEWQVSYSGRTKCARKQVDTHIRTMWEYLQPISRDTKLQFTALVVSPDPTTPEAVKAGYRNAELVLLPANKLIQFIHERFNFDLNPSQPTPELFRVSQSPFLDLLRLSMPIPALGHPELSSAIRYIDRCRRTLDQTLFDDFKPRPERWLINGSAGMGKSVLLAYAAAVLSSGRELYRFQGETGVKEATEVLETTAFDPKTGPIAMLAMSSKQLDSLRGWFEFFVSLFEESDLSGDLHFRRPEFLLARNVNEWVTYKRTFSAVLLDEAHDLPEHAARSLREIYDLSPFYLVVACDRHQQLRLAGTDARVMTGFDFTNKYVRLKQIYRNPAPVYIASLALMFRWFGEGGPKVVPSDKEFSSYFGFSPVLPGQKDPTLTMKNDAHPANSWSHVVAAFPDVATAAATLRREKLGTNEVLWVRFSEEHPDYDYESLQRDFTYHNFRSREAYKLSDKYIKGQDFPVVVIEGFPSFMEQFDTEESADKMWQFRRELYLCASRATCFLYFVCDVKETEEVSAIRQEIARLLDAVGTPHSAPDANGSKPWTFRITAPDRVEGYDVFSDLREASDSPEGVAEVEGSQTPEAPPEPVPAAPAPVRDSPKPAPASAAPMPPPVKAEPSTTSSPESEEPDEEAQDEEIPERWELTIYEPQTAKEFSDLAGVELFKVLEALNDIGCFEGPNRPIPVETLARIAPHFHCEVLGYDDPASGQRTGKPSGSAVLLPAAGSTSSEASSPPVEDVPDDTYLIEDKVVVLDLAARLGLKPFQLMGDLIRLKILVAPNEQIDPFTAAKLCQMHGYPCRVDDSLKTGGRAPKKKSPGEQTETKKNREKNNSTDSTQSFILVGSPKTRAFNALSQAFDEINVSDLEDSSQSFALRHGVFVRRGVWIEDTRLGIGKIMNICTQSRDWDAHDVWFASKGKVIRYHPLRGTTSRILHESKVPLAIREDAPK